ncbi:ORF53 [Felid gammaherpesvirus 1]|uniref:ORF53 n=1 Tax=Felid gammaherpesvirus 1 TaxID=2560468 RepID=A0A0M4LRT4_9GAMA|nr:ORF53 [Felis catus gammaherpesvirus 1]ALE14767.1 ORF53 [Felis catus gammaherpesvirus 1]
MTYIPTLVTLIQVVTLIGANGSTSTTPSTPTPSTTPSFYDYSCNSDTYTLELTSFSSIWAIINMVVILISTIIYLIYICFNKFVNTMTLN